MRVEVSERRVQGSGFKVQGSGFRVHDSGFSRVLGSGFRVRHIGCMSSGLEFMVSGFGLIIEGLRSAGAERTQGDTREDARV